MKTKMIIKRKKKKKHKTKHKKEESDDEEINEEPKKEVRDVGDDEDKESGGEDEEEEKVISVKKESTKLRAKKKSDNPSSTPANSKLSSSGTKTKPSNISSATKSSKTTKSSKAPALKTPASKTTNQNKINAPKTTGATSSRINTTGNTGLSRPTKPATAVAKPGRKISQETKENKDSKLKLPPKRPPGSSSVGKRKQTSSVGKRTGPALNDQVEQTLEFKKILNKNRIEKVKNDTEKTTCLLYIINDYFKLKEIDNYFKNIVENNPIFKNFSAKIYANIKNTKEFTLKKLSGICKYIAAGDKNGFNNFLKTKDKGGKHSFENMKSAYNSLLKSGPLKNLNENNIGEFCKMILEIPELSVQTSKSLLKYCE